MQAWHRLAAHGPQQGFPPQRNGLTLPIMSASSSKLQQVVGMGEADGAQQPASNGVLPLLPPVSFLDGAGRIRSAIK